MGNDIVQEKQLEDKEVRKKLSILDWLWAYMTESAIINSKKFYTIGEIRELYEKNKSQLLQLITAHPGKASQGHVELARRIKNISKSTLSTFHSFLWLIQKNFDLEE